jgi:hypothetical protein
MNDKWLITLVDAATVLPLDVMTDTVTGTALSSAFILFELVALATSR